jgi:hypothetical protein
VADPDRYYERDPEARERDDRPEADTRRSLEGTLADLIRRGIEAGRGSFERVGDSIAPRDVASGIASQIGDLRQAIVRAVAQEVGMFLREADIATELRKVVDGMSIEARLKLGFDDHGAAKAKTSAKVTQEAKADEDTPQPDKPKRRSPTRR